jgi:hypothetical protein
MARGHNAARIAQRGRAGRRVMDGQRGRQIEEQRTLPGLLDGLGPKLAFAFGGRVRFGGQQRDVQVGGFAATARE